MSGKKYNSIDKTQSDMIKNQNLILEILTKIDQAMTTDKSHITIKNIDQNGNEIIQELPSFSFVNSRLEQMYKVVRQITGFNGYPTTMLLDNEGKKIFAIDNNEEPEKIVGLAPLTTFKASPWWIFDDMMNPKISVELDLTDKINDNINKIKIKRFIVKFETLEIKEDNGYTYTRLTSDGEKRKAEFEEKYNGSSNIDLYEFLDWLGSDGLENKDNDYLLDEDTFEIEPLNIKFKGDFNILSTEIDSVNNKLWYIFESLHYYDLTDGFGQEKIVELKEGNILAVNNPNGSSATTYKVVEISTITSQYRVRLQRLFGEEPVPIMQAGLRINSGSDDQRKVRISIGHDEYSVLFIKPINHYTHIQAVEWSSGIGFYTNELRKDNSAGALFTDFYVNNVLDYGLVLDELVNKRKPEKYGLIPNAPVLIEENFSVVQTNKHLTDTVDAERIRDLHNNKENLQSEILQISNRIEKQNAIIAKTKYETIAEKKSAQEEVAKLNVSLTNKINYKNKVVDDILKSKKNINKIKPTYSLRGIFPFPKAVASSDTKPQEVVQFEIWYRKLSKSGDENELKTFKDISKTTTSNTSKKDLTDEDRRLNDNSVNVNATFSNWIKYKTDARKLVKDKDTGEYIWEIEDVSDANTPTINQVDIPVEVGETIEIKIKSLSEIGYPEAPIESVFSNTLVIPFPENLESILNEDDFILNDAMVDDLKIDVLKDLENRGLMLHLDSQIRDVDVYYAHRSEAIASGFKDDNGNIINLYEYLLYLRNEIAGLREEINRSKGILEIYLISGNTKKRIYNKDNVKVSVNLENYLTRTTVGVLGHDIDLGKRVYKNEVTRIAEFGIQIKNAAQEALLGMLSDRGYGSPSGFSPSTFAYGANFDTTNYEVLVQPFYVDGSGNPLFGEYDITKGNNGKEPRCGTQLNNSWLWQKILDIDNEPFCATGDKASSNPNDHKTKYEDSSKELYYVAPNSIQQSLSADNVVNSDRTLTYDGIDFLRTKNFGFNGHNAELFQYAAGTMDKIQNLGDERLFSLGTMVSDIESHKRSEFVSSVHAGLNSLNDVVDKSSDKLHFLATGDDNAFTIPLYIYAKPNAFSEDFYLDGSTIKNVDISTAAISSNPTITTGDRISFTSQSLADMLNTSATHNKKHKIMFMNFTGFNSDLNYKLYNIYSISGQTITVDVKPQSDINTSALTINNIAQIHICHTNNQGGNDGNGSSNPIETYNVYNNAGIGPIVSSYCLIKSGSIPQVQTKGVGFYMETETSIRPVEFDVKFKISQHQVQLGTTYVPYTPSISLG